MKKGKLLWYNRLKGFHRGFPMNIVSKVAKGMQYVLTYASDIIAGQTGFIQRLRKLTGKK